MKVWAQNQCLYKIKKDKENEKEEAIIVKTSVVEKETNESQLTSDVMFEILQTDQLPTMEAGMMCIIDREMFFSFMKNMWIRGSGISCHITNNNLGLDDVRTSTNW